MPIAPVVDARTDPPPATATPSAPGAPAEADGFERALAAQTQHGVSSLPTVTLGQMVDYAATGKLRGEPAGEVVDGLAAAEATGVAGSASEGNSEVLDAAERYLGTPYLWGGTDPDKGLDCSGFVQQVYADLGVHLPRVSIEQSQQGTG
ncbi:MAG: C40 family peptidase, partial [Nitriliruptoraceae bacterium]